MNKEVKQNSSPSSGRLEADNYTGGSCDQELGSTNVYSTKTKESGGWGSCNVNQETNLLTSGPGKNDKVTDASSNSEGYQLPDAGSNKGCSPPPDTDSDYGGLGPLPDEDSMSSWSNESTDSSNYGSEGNSSGSLDYFSLLELLEKDPPLAEIPLTAKEKKLIGEFYEKMKGVREENYREYQENLRDWCTDFLRTCLEKE